MSKNSRFYPFIDGQKTRKHEISENSESESGERYYLSKDTFEESRSYEAGGDDDQVPVTLLLDEGDEVIDFRIAERIYRDRANLQIYPDGYYCAQTKAVLFAEDNGRPCLAQKVVWSCLSAIPIAQRLPKPIEDRAKIYGKQGADANNQSVLFFCFVGNKMSGVALVGA